MTLYEFNSLDEQEQAEAVWDSVHIGERWVEEHNILLYQRDEFYFEVFHHKEYKVIRRIRAFRNVSQLGPYLDSINIANLINGESNI